MPHALTRLLAQARGHHLVILPQRAVKHDHIGPVQARLQVRFERGTAGNVEHIPIPCLQMYPYRLFAFQIGLNLRPFQIKRDFARDSKQRGLHARDQVEWRAEGNCLADHDIGFQRCKNRISRNDVVNILCRKQREGLLFTQCQQPRDVVDIAVGQQHGFQRADPQIRRVQHLRPRHLIADIRRGIQNSPIRAIGTAGYRRL